MRRVLTAVLTVCAAFFFGAIAGAQEAAPETPPPPDQHGEEHASIFPKMSLLGFTDFNYSSTSDQNGSTSGFMEGQFVLHFTSALTDRFTFFAETSLTANTAAGTNAAAQTFRTEVERAIVKYDHSDLFKASFGRYHTPINYWNVAFHHGQWLQTTISRPEMIRFGGEFLPVHFVGGLVEGSHPAGGLNLNYNFGLGNGRARVISRAGDAGDVDDSRATSLALFAKPDRPYGLRLGGAIYRDRISNPAGTIAADERILAAHAVWARESPEIVAEYARVEHDLDGGGGSASNTAWYVQAAFRLAFDGNRWKPYGRYERMTITGSDPFFTSVPSVKLFTAGVRYDIAPVVAVKLEYRRNQTGTPYRRGAFAQICFAF